MNSKELIKQYVTTGQAIPKYQLGKLAERSKNLLASYMRARGLALEHVELKDYELRYLDYMPEEYLGNIKELDLDENQLTSLPESIGRLTNLEELYLYGNQLRYEEKKRINQLLPKTRIYF